MRLQWRDLAPGLDPALRGLLDRLTEPAPEARYKSAKTALRALHTRHASQRAVREEAAPAPPPAAVPAPAAQPAPAPALAAQPAPAPAAPSAVSGISGVRAHGAPRAPVAVAVGLILLTLVAVLGALLALVSSQDDSSGAAGRSPAASAPPPAPASDAKPLPVTFHAPKGLTWRLFAANAELTSYLTLTGTVRNDTAQPLATIQGRVRAYDAAGALVGTTDASTWPSYRPALLPGESAPLGASPCTLSAAPARVEIHLTAEPAEATDASAVSHHDPIALHWDTPQPPGVDLEVRERAWRLLDIWRPKGAPPVWQWSLDVTNTGQRPLTFVQLEARGLDRDGRLVAQEGSLRPNRSYVVGQDPLPPGATTAVRLQLKAARPIHERQVFVMGLRVPR